MNIKERYDKNMLASCIKIIENNYSYKLLDSSNKYITTGYVVNLPEQNAKLVHLINDDEINFYYIDKDGYECQATFKVTDPQEKLFALLQTLIIHENKSKGRKLHFSSGVYYIELDLIAPILNGVRAKESNFTVDNNTYLYLYEPNHYELLREKMNDIVKVVEKEEGCNNISITILKQDYFFTEYSSVTLTLY